MARPCSALIIDDEPHARAYLHLLLKQAGLKTIWEAENGEQGLELVRTEKPELVLLDLNMPWMPGIDVLRRLKELYPEIPVIVVSGENAMHMVLKCNELGAAGYVLKQQPREEVLKMLTEAINALDEDDVE